MHSEDVSDISTAEKKKVEEKSIEISQHFRDAKKHYVRKYGWVEAVRNRLKKSKKRLRYFTLCGSEAIDIFLFEKEGFIEYDGKGYPDVCFCEHDYSTFVKARERLGRTVSWRRDLEYLVKDNTFRKAIPFDVINLDYTSNCFPINEEPFSNTLQTIKTIIQLQSNHSFTLFITFRAQASIENRQAIDELKMNMRTNFERYTKTKELYKKRTSLSLDELANNSYPEFLLLALPKIIIGWGATYGFSTSNDKQFIYSRTGSSGTYHIVKLIFDFEVVKTKTGFSNDSRLVETLTDAYVESVMKSFSTLLINVDQLLEKPQLKEQLEEEVNAIITSHTII